MVFSDIFFLFIFLPLFLICYFAAKNNRIKYVLLIVIAAAFYLRGEPFWGILLITSAVYDIFCVIFSKEINPKNSILVAFSLFFYSWGEPVWVALLIFSSVFDYLNGRFIDKHRGEKNAVLGVIMSCTVNLAILGVFKYSTLIVSAINGVGGLSIPVPSFHLPIGISFYTFQSITYVVDVYRGKARVQKNWVNYLLYLSMFFQLVAGPIVRYSDVAREIDKRSMKLAEFSDGITRLIFGLGKKVLIANSMGQLANELLTFDTVPESALAAWGGIIMYTLQIYFDFSGYSDMAIGMGLMCGFHFPENFEHPYVSTSVTEFWRRWHISLGTFFRDYVYIPLGGNRKHQFLNIAVVWFCTGLWHGASANFILWGLYFGVLLVIEKTFLLDVLKKIPKLFGHIYLVFAVIFGWLIFYFTDMGQFTACLGAMFGRGDLIPVSEDILTRSRLESDLWLIIIAVILCTPIYSRISAAGEKLAKKSKAGFVTASTVKLLFLAGVLFLSSVSLVGDTYNPFLYYRF